MHLLSQDFVVAVWESLDQGPPGALTYAAMARALHMSPSQLFQSVRRCAWAHLRVPAMSGARTIQVPQRENLIEFAIHGVKYAFPAERRDIQRGLPTIRGAPIFRGEFGVPAEAIVWPDSTGAARGVSLLPLHRIVPLVAKVNPAFYNAMALVDALRAGDSRERKFAERKLPELLKGGS